MCTRREAVKGAGRPSKPRRDTISRLQGEGDATLPRPAGSETHEDRRARIVIGRRSQGHRPGRGDRGGGDPGLRLGAHDVAGEDTRREGDGEVPRAGRGHEDRHRILPRRLSHQPGLAESGARGQGRRFPDQVPDGGGEDRLQGHDLPRRQPQGARVRDGVASDRRVVPPSPRRIAGRPLADHREQRRHGPVDRLDVAGDRGDHAGGGQRAGEGLPRHPALLRQRLRRSLEGGPGPGHDGVRRGDRPREPGRGARQRLEGPVRGRVGPAREHRRGLYRD